MSYKFLVADLFLQSSATLTQGMTLVDVVLVTWPLMSCMWNVNQAHLFTYWAGIKLSAVYMLHANILSMILCAVVVSKHFLGLCSYWLAAIWHILCIHIASDSNSASFEPSQLHPQATNFWWQIYFNRAQQHWHKAWHWWVWYLSHDHSCLVRKMWTRHICLLTELA